LKKHKDKKREDYLHFELKHFSEDSDISDESFKNLLKRLADMDHEAFVTENIGDND